jgi:hypothetical protein
MVNQTQNLAKVIGLFIVLLSGIIFASVVADQVFNAVTVTNGLNETHTVTAGVNFTLNNDDLQAISSITGHNESVAGEIANISLGDGNFTVTIVDTQTSTIFINESGILNFSYTYAGDQYIQGSTNARTIFALITLFFVLGVLILAIKGVVDMGLLDNFRRK